MLAYQKRINSYNYRSMFVATLVYKYYYGADHTYKVYKITDNFHFGLFVTSLSLVYNKCIVYKFV